MEQSNEQTEDRQFFLSIPKTELNMLPAAVYDGEIIVIEREEEIDSAVNYLRGADIIGFDTETKPAFKRGQTNLVSLIQLATTDRCYLFRINKTGFADNLRILLEDASILKVGVSIHDDFLNLQKFGKFEPDGFIDLQQYVKQFRIKDNSLARIYGILFGLRISKGQRLTNWEAAKLTSHQMAYAALDAKACINIYEKLLSGTFAPERSQYLNYPEEEPQDEQ